MKLEDSRFTEKQVKRILAEASEREERNRRLEEETINYSQLVEIAEEARIDSKYLKVSTKQLVKEKSGLEKLATKNILEKTRRFFRGFLEGHFIVPTVLSKFGREELENTIPYRIGAVVPIFGTLLVGAYPIVGYYFLFNYDPKIATATLATQVTTNVGSGLYEWYRHEKNKLVEEMNNHESPTLLKS